MSGSMSRCEVGAGGVAAGTKGDEGEQGAQCGTHRFPSKRGSSRSSGSSKQDQSFPAPTAATRACREIGQKKWRGAPASAACVSKSRSPPGGAAQEMREAGRQCRAGWARRVEGEVQGSTSHQLRRSTSHRPAFKQASKQAGSWRLSRQARQPTLELQPTCSQRILLCCRSCRCPPGRRASRATTDRLD